MTKKCCTCKLIKNLSEFHKYYKSKDGHTWRCKKCCAIYSKQHLSKPEIKEKRSIYARKYYNNKPLEEKQRIENYVKKRQSISLKKWEKIIKKQRGKFKCEICGKILVFTSRGNGNGYLRTIYWDHRTGDELIKIPPSNWLLSHISNKKNIKIWNSCDFGMLCMECNKKVGGPYNRKFFIKNVYKYIFNRPISKKERG